MCRQTGGCDSLVGTGGFGYVEFFFSFLSGGRRRTDREEKERHFPPPWSTLKRWTLYVVKLPPLFYSHPVIVQKCLLQLSRALGSAAILASASDLDNDVAIIQEPYRIVLAVRRACSSSSFWTACVRDLLLAADAEY